MTLVKYLCSGILEGAAWEDILCIKGDYKSFTFNHRTDGIEGIRPHKDGWVDITTPIPLSNASVKAAIESYIGTEITLIETGECIAV